MARKNLAASNGKNSGCGPLRGFVRHDHIQLLQALQALWASRNYKPAS